MEESRWLYPGEQELNGEIAVGRVRLVKCPMTWNGESAVDIIRIRSGSNVLTAKWLWIVHSRRGDVVGGKGIALRAAG